MKIIIAFCMAMVCLGTGMELALAFDPWDKTDYTLHAAFTVLHTVDMLQTMKIARNADEYHEHNPILGRNPNQTEVVAYFASTWLLQTALVHVLPSSWRTYAQSVMIAIPFGCVVNNLSIGLNLGF